MIEIKTVDPSLTATYCLGAALIYHMSSQCHTGSCRYAPALVGSMQTSECVEPEPKTEPSPSVHLCMLGAAVAL